MTTDPIPVVFEPIFKEKPWGGRMLERLFGKRLPAGKAIGESWELVSLPGNESVVRSGPFAGKSVAELVSAWGTDLLGDAPLIDGRFPLLIKFLDAREHLSVQVHPKPRSTDLAALEPGVKHEAWYVLASDAQAKMFIGLREGISADAVKRAANTPGSAEQLQTWDVAAGQCFYLPSGTVHALGAGIVVAEIQTPSDITYRLYDWERRDERGKPRELHIEQALENIRYDVADREIVQAQTDVGHPIGAGVRVAACPRFTIDKVELGGDVAAPFQPGEMVVWVVLDGRGRLVAGGHDSGFSAGDVVLFPARSVPVGIEVEEGCTLLEVRIPITSPHA